MPESPKQKAARERAEKLAEIERQVAAGELTVRRATDAERVQWRLEREARRG